MRRRRTIIALGLVVVVASVLFVVLRDKKPEPIGYAGTFQVLEDGGAAAVWHARGRSLLLVRFDASGRVMWKRPTGLSGIHTSIVAGEGAIIVRTWTAHLPVDTDAIAALDLDGRLLWVRPADSQRGWNGRPDLGDLERPMIVAGKYIDGVIEDGQDSLFALDIVTGKPSWKLPMPHSSVPIVLGKRVLFEGLYKVTAVDVETGTTKTAAVQGHGCIVGDVYYSITDRETLTAFPNGDLSAPRAIRALSFETQRRLLGGAESCGTHGDELVFTFQTRSLFPRDPRSAFMLIVGFDGQVRHAYEMAAGEATDALDGALPRFVILRDGPHETARLSIFDLDERKIVWQGPADGSASRRKLLRVADRWILSWEERDEGRTVIAMLDGGTGTLRATAMRAFLPWGGLQPEHATEKSIWSFISSGSMRSTLEGLHRVVLDTSTVTPRVARGVEVADWTQSAKLSLGM